MEKEEARTILQDRIGRYRRLSYDELKARIGDVETEEVTAPSGRWYQLESQVFWDDQPGGDVRVIVSIHDGGLRAFVPLTEDFIQAPTGRFVPETAEDI